MTTETFDVDGKTYSIKYGFGRLQKVHYLIYTYLPDSIKRIQASGGEVEESDAEKVSADERLEYQSKLAPALAKLVLSSAFDWDPSKMGVDEYVDTCLQESAGFEIVKRVRQAASSLSLSAEGKKTS